jgi:four helix bundle protein
MGARSYRDLHCWQLATELKHRIYEFTSPDVVATDRRFCEQIRDAASGATRNLAEGFGRYTHAEFARFVSIARGSLMETQDLLADAAKLRYITSAQHEELDPLAHRCIGATTRLLRYLRTHPTAPRT